MNDAELLRPDSWSGVLHLARYTANLRDLVKLALTRLDFQDFLSEVPHYREILNRAMQEEPLVLPEDFRMSLPPRLKAV